MVHYGKLGDLINPSTAHGAALESCGFDCRQSATSWQTDKPAGLSPCSPLPFRAVALLRVAQARSAGAKLSVSGATLLKPGAALEFFEFDRRQSAALRQTDKPFRLVTLQSKS